jgi:hypothetical protein
MGGFGNTEEKEELPQQEGQDETDGQADIGGANL